MKTMNPYMNDEALKPPEAAGAILNHSSAKEPFSPGRAAAAVGPA